MPGMLELPQLPQAPQYMPHLRLRHAIVGTNYYVEIFVVHEGEGAQRDAGITGDLVWAERADLPNLPLTGLARKVLQRTGVMAAEILAPAPVTEDAAHADSSKEPASAIRGSRERHPS